jgi:hypothetical protein
MQAHSKWKTSQSVSFPLIYRSFARTLLISPNRRHPFVTPDYLRGLKPWGAGGGLICFRHFYKNDTGQSESPFQDISACFSTTEAYCEKTYSRPRIAWSLVSQDRRHLFDIPYILNHEWSFADNGKILRLIPRPWLFIFVTFLHLYEGRPLQTCMQQQPDARVHCTAHAQTKWCVQCSNVIIERTFCTRAKQGCQLMK